MKIIQFNCNGYYTRLNDIQQLLNDQLPNILCLQETHLKQTKPPYLKGYHAFNKYRANQQAWGGVSTFVNQEIYSENVQLNTNLEAVAIQIHLPQKWTICNVYIPPNYQLEITEMEDLINQLPIPYIIVGDFNSHNSIWGCEKTNGKGRIIENILDNFNHLTLLNDGRPTHLDFNTNKYSAIDLSFCHTRLNHLIIWSPLHSLYGSDHFPLMLNTNTKTPKHTTPPKWKITKANWTLFTEKIEQNNLTFTENLDIETNVTQITNKILEAASIAIPVRQPNDQRKYQVPW